MLGVSRGMSSMFANQALLERAMDWAERRLSAISDNIANISTPNYKRKDVAWVDELAKNDQRKFVGRRTDPRHFFIGRRPDWAIKPRPFVEATTTSRNDGNNVDLDTELANLQKTALYYQAITQMYSDHISRIRTVLRGAR